VVWLGFAAAIVVLAILDLFVLHRGHHEVSLREAAIGSVGWTVLGLAFTGVVALLGNRDDATAYVTGFLLEKTLSLDNVAVFAVLFAGFGVPELLRSRLLSIGVLAALVLRIVFIAAGLVVLEAVHAVLYGFGALLVITGVRMLTKHDEHEPRPADSRVLRLLGRVVPLSPDYDGQRYLTRRRTGAGRVQLHATPLLAAVIALAAADVVFAVDSIPAVFGITTSASLIVACNAFALMGLRQLYFMVGGLLTRLVYLSRGLAIVLAFIGVKMLLDPHLKEHELREARWFQIEIDPNVSLAVVASIILTSMIISLIVARRGHPAARKAQDDSEPDSP